MLKLLMNYWCIEFVCFFGAPKLLITDNNTAFTENIMKYILHAILNGDAHRIQYY